MTSSVNPFNQETNNRSHGLWAVCSELQSQSEGKGRHFSVLKTYCDKNKSGLQSENFVKEMQNPQVSMVRSLGDRVEQLTGRGPTLFQKVASQYRGLRECIHENEEYFSLREKWAEEQRDFVLGFQEGSQGGEQSIQENAVLTRRISELEMKQYQEDDEGGFDIRHRRAVSPPIARAHSVPQNRVTKEKALLNLYNKSRAEGIQRKQEYIPFIEEDALILKAMLRKKEITIEEAQKFHGTYSEVLKALESEDSSAVSQNVQALKKEIDKTLSPWFGARVQVVNVEEVAATENESMAYMASKVVVIAAAAAIIFGSGLFWGGHLSK